MARMQATLGKLEVNLEEAAKLLYLHAAFPAARPFRAEILTDIRQERTEIEQALTDLDRPGAPEPVRQTVAAFRAGLPQMASMSEPIAAASAERPASPDALLAHHRAVVALYRSVDTALISMLPR